MKKAIICIMLIGSALQAQVSFQSFDQTKNTAAFSHEVIAFLSK